MNGDSDLAPWLTRILSALRRSLPLIPKEAAADVEYALDGVVAVLGKVTSGDGRFEAADSQHFGRVQGQTARSQTVSVRFENDDGQGQLILPVNPSRPSKFLDQLLRTHPLAARSAASSLPVDCPTPIL